MKGTFSFLLLIFFLVPAWGQVQLEKELERLNFFPQSDAFFLATYEHERLNIETPRAAVRTKEVNNHSNVIALTYAHRFGRKLFVGLTGQLEEASENAVTYGIPLKRRFTSVGPKEPELFVLYRLKHQKKDKGLYDLRLSYSPTFGRREVGKENANRLRGRDLTELRLSHGLWEEEWEFRTALNVAYYAEGLERNAFNDGMVRLGSFFTVNFQFATQYRIDPWLFAFGSAGIVYTSSESIRPPAAEKRQILSGTGSVFSAGLKRPLGEWSLLEFAYTIQRNEYFVKSLEDNLEGEALLQSLALTYRAAF